MFAERIKSGQPIAMPNLTISPIDTGDIGKCAAVCLTEGPDKHSAKYYEMNGPKKVSISEVFSEIGKAVGKSIEFKAIRAQDAMGPSYLKQLFEYMESAGENAAPHNMDVKNLIGDEWTSVPRWVAANKHIFE